MRQLELTPTMPRIACIQVPALPLQVVLQQHPEWHSEPVVVMESTKPTAPVLWVNRVARQNGIQKGLPLSQAQALSALLKVEFIDEAHTNAAVDTLFDLLLTYSPYVEPDPHIPGLFFTDPNGLGSLFGDFTHWANTVHQALTQAHWHCGVAVGFMRPLLYALANVQSSGVYVSQDREQERTSAERVALSQLHLPASQHEQMARLGVHTVKDLLALPAAGLKLRYGAELATLQDFLCGKRWTPLQPKAPAPPLCFQHDLEPPAEDIARLLFLFKSQFQEAAHQLSQRSAAITAFTVTLHPEYEPPATTPATERSANVADTTADTQQEQVGDPNLLQGSFHTRIEAAAPTLDTVQLVDLLRLRLGPVTLTAPINRTELHFEHVPVHPKQLALPTAKPTRNLAAANQALARIKATFSPEATTYAKLRPAHLPEATFTFEPCREVRLPSPKATDHFMPLVRRVLRPPRPLSKHPDQAPDACFRNLRPLSGPYRIAGGWWNKPTERDYYFAATVTGDTLWLYYDRPRDRWFIHGELR